MTDARRLSGHKGPDRVLDVPDLQSLMIGGPVGRALHPGQPRSVAGQTSSPSTAPLAGL
jgi:hypothetical protein